jgi:hypothetical protein
MVVIRVKGSDFSVVDRVPAAAVAIADECLRF